MTSRARRNLIALMIGAVLILPVAYYKASHNEGVFYLWNKLQNTDAAQKLHKLSSLMHNGVNVQAEQVIDLAGEWRFHIGDDPAWIAEAYDDHDWNHIRVPQTWEEQGYPGYDGYAWYRYEFTLPPTLLKRALYLHLGRIDDTDEVFVNGVRVGGSGNFPPTYETAFSTPRTYFLPQDVIREGNNSLAVRVYDARLGGGIEWGDIGVYAANLPVPLVNLEGEWQFRIDANTDYQTVQVPKKWEEQGYPDYDGIAWYKKTFPALDAAKGETLLLILGKIDDTDEVFLNGQLIGRTGRLDNSDRKIDPEYYLLERRYEFSADLLQETNTLEVRVHDNQGDGGIYAGPLAIVRKSEYLAIQNY